MYIRITLIGHSPTSFCTRFNIESFEGSATISYQSPEKGKRTIRMVLRGYLEKSRKGLLISVDSGAYLLRYLFRSQEQVGDGPLRVNYLRAG